jgi:hypothetical protein
MKRFEQVKKVEEVTHLTPEEGQYSITIIKSGWKNKYHVITEWGDTGESIHKIANQLELAQQYGLKMDGFPKLLGQSVAISVEKIMATPNDMDLGEQVRKLIK